MTNEKGMNFFKVMVDPHGFMRSLSPSMRRKSWLLYWLVGTMVLLSKAFVFSLGTIYSLFSIVVVSVIFGIPVGYIVIYLYAFFLFFTGKILRGQATFQQVVDAYLWTRIVELFPLLVWIGLMCIFGERAFSPLFLQTQTFGPLVGSLIGLQLCFQLWGVVILFHTLAEVQGLSAWVTIWNVVFASVLLLIVDGAVNWIVSSSMYVGSFDTIGSLLFR